MSIYRIVPKRHVDRRGWFEEVYNAARFRQFGLDRPWCQDNQSFSHKAGTLRGLHFQEPPGAQAKLIRCLRGAIYDVVVDVRNNSPTFGKWLSTKLTAEDGIQLFIPPGYAHGFMSLEDNSEVIYKVDAFYSPELDSGILWNDPMIGINWIIPGSAPIVSDKDALLPSLQDFTCSFPYDGHPMRYIDIK